MSDIPVIPQANIDMLRQNPDIARQAFDAMYGEGAADRVLFGAPRVNVNQTPTPDDVEEDNESWVGWTLGESIGAVAYGIQSAANEGVKSVEAFDEWISRDVLGDIPTRLVIGQDAEGNWQFNLKTYNETLDMGAQRDFLLGGELGVSRDTYEADMVEAPETMVGMGVAGISQFVTGLVGVGKFTKLKGVYGALVNGAIVDAALFNPNNPNLTKMLEEFNIDTGVFGELMATDPDDPEWQNRLRNAAEGTLIGGLVEAVAWGVRARKLQNAGRVEEAAEAARQAALASRKIEAELLRSGKALSDDVGATLKLADRIQGIDAAKILKAALDDAADAADDMRVTSVPANQARRLTPDEVKIIGEVAGIRKISKSNSPRITPNLAEGLGITRRGAIKSWEDVLPVMSALRTTMKSEWDAVAPNKTVPNRVTHVKAAAAAREMAELTGETPDALIARFKAGFEDVDEMSVELAARGAIVKSLLKRADKMEAYIASGRWDPSDWKGYQTRDDLIEDYQNTMSLSNALAMEYSKSRSEVGRTLQALKVDASTAAQIDAVGRMRGDVEMYAKARQDAKKNGLKKTDKQLKEEVSAARKVADAVNSYRVNALLSGPGTQEVNFISTLLQTIKIPTEQIIGGAMKADTRVMLHGLRTMRGMIASSFDAVAMAAQAWKQSDAVLDTVNKVEDGAQASIPGVLQLPSRMLLAMDEMFKQSAYRGRIIADAAEAADAARLRGPERTKFIQGYIADSFDASGKATRKDALLQAQRSTFTQPLEPGSWGAMIQQTAGRYPLVRFVVPFVRTPINILSEATQMMPVVNRVSRRRRDDLAAGGLRAAQSNGKLALGYAISLGAAWIATQGLITGGGPKDPRLKKAWMAAGNRPYSIKLEQPDGSIRWISYARYEPAAQVASIIADWVEISKNEYGENEANGLFGVAQAAAMSFAENSINKTFTQGIHDFFTIMTGSDPNKAERALYAMGTSFIPNLLNQTNGDEVYREARTFMDQIKNRTPGYGSLDPKRNVLGEVVYRANPKYDPMSITRIDIVPTDEVTREIWQVAKGAQSVGGNPSRFMDGFPEQPNGRIDMAKIPYKEGQSLYDRYLELIGTVEINGNTLREALAKEFKTKAYIESLPGTDGMTKGTKAYRIEKIISAYRKRAEGELPEMIDLRRQSAKQQQLRLFEHRRELSGARSAPIFMPTPLNGIGSN